MALDWDGEDLVSCGIDGKMYHWRVGNNTFELINTWSAHDLEAWMVKINPAQPDTVWSGSDDSSLRMWDLRAPMVTGAQVTSMHEAGVVSIEFDKLAPHSLLTGSYDECLRVWDVRSMRRPVYTSDKYGDGVWRLRWHPEQSGLLLVAGMRSGVHIVDTHKLGEPDVSTVQVGHYQAHEDMYPADGPPVDAFLAYGADWCHKMEPNGERLGASVSFYDHSVHVWAARPC